MTRNSMYFPIFKDLLTQEFVEFKVDPNMSVNSLLAAAKLFGLQNGFKVKQSTDYDLGVIKLTKVNRSPSIDQVLKQVDGYPEKGPTD